ncbi:MAG: 2'-5' RNA ligase, partial [Acidobacteria bacterium 37-65-4]
VAVELPEAARDVIATGLGRLKRDQPSARWVRPEGMHLTLRFLGKRPEGFVAELDRTAAPALAALPVVRVRLGGGGFFPNGHRPRVAWVGGEADGLERWVRAVDDAAASLGVERESRPYSPHLTLARLERPWGVQAVEHFRVEVGKWHLPEFEAHEAMLFRSELTPAGPVYTALRRWRAGVGGGDGDGA